MTEEGPRHKALPGELAIQVSYFHYWASFGQCLASGSC